MDASKACAQKLGYDEQNGESLGQILAWVNFKHYCAVIFWFVVMGGAGCVLYATFRYFHDYAKQIGMLAKYNSTIGAILFWLNWLPARITSFGYLIIGNFSRGTGCFIRYLLDFSSPNRKVVITTAVAAEQIEKKYEGCTYEATCMVRLVKRNILFYLVLIAILTLFGGVA